MLGLSASLTGSGGVLMEAPSAPLSFEFSYAGQKEKPSELVAYSVAGPNRFKHNQSFSGIDHMLMHEITNSQVGEGSHGVTIVEPYSSMTGTDKFEITFKIYIKKSDFADAAGQPGFSQITTSFGGESKTVNVPQNQLYTFTTGLKDITGQSGSDRNMIIRFTDGVADTAGAQYFLKDMLFQIFDHS